jgi:hypothetical protein
MSGEESHTVRPIVLQGTTTAPAGLTAAPAGDDGVALTWAAPLFPPAVTGYELQRADDESFAEGLRTLASPGTKTAYTDDTAQAGESYHYRVRSTTAAGWSPWSAPAEVTTP